MEISLNARYEHNQDLLKKQVDRKTEIKNCVSTLLTTNLNIYIYGDRGVGKTFLLKAIYSKLIENDSSVFPFFVDLFNLSRLEVIDSDFPQLLALELLSSIWQTLYNQPYSSLLPSDNDLEQKFYEERLQYIRKLYHQLRVSVSKKRYNDKTSLGIATIIKSSIDSDVTKEDEFPKLLPVEIINLIEEVKQFLLIKEKKRKLIVICDEANLMSDEWQKQIIFRHLDIFTNLNLQFVFVAGDLMQFPGYDLENCFEYIFKLEGLPPKYIEEICQNYFPDFKITFDDKILKYLTKETQGNPRVAMGIVHSALLECETKTVHFNSKSHFSKHLKAWFKLLSERIKL